MGLEMDQVVFGDVYLSFAHKSLGTTASSSNISQLGAAW